ncbi:uncharacterized protein LOC144579836 isoform X1 [Callithrix jacchus]
MKYAEGGKRRPLPEKLVSRATSPVNWGEGWTFGTLREYSGPCRRDGWSSTSGKTRVTSSSIPVLRTTSRWPTRKPGPSPWFAFGFAWFMEVALDGSQQQETTSWLQEWPKSEFTAWHRNTGFLGSWNLPYESPHFHHPLHP